MHLSRVTSLLVVFSLLCSLCIAQAQPAVDPEKEKAKKELDEKLIQMLDQAIADAGFLRLPQNKAIVYAMAGDLYWKFDEKKSRDLFRSSGSELLLANIEIEQEKKESTDPLFTMMPDFNDARTQVLPLVAKNDAELALELLVQTRPASLTEAILKASAPDARSDGTMNFNPENQRVQQEIALEQRFALLAADDNPDRAIKLIKDSLSKGVSNNVLQLLQKLHKKDEKKASELAGDVIKKLVETDLAKKSDQLQSALNFIQFMARTPPAGADTAAARSKAFQFTDSQARELATKVVNAFLQPSNSMSIPMLLTRALPNLEKLLPEKAALLKQRLADSQRSLPTEMRNSMRVQRMFDPNSTPEQILAEIPKLQNEFERTQAYGFLAGKISQIDDEARARKLIDQIPDEKARTRAVEQLESSRISGAAGSGRLEDARKMIGTLSNKKLQIQKLVSLAQTFHKKGTEADLESAAGLMKQARGMINESPEDEDELNDLMEVVKGYAVIEPDVAFRLFEPIVDQINDYIHASAILSKYNKRNRTFRKGELVLRVAGNSFDGILLFRYLNQMQLLGKADLARMNALSDRFQRSDSRTIVKLVVAQGFMKNDKNPNAGADTPMINYVAY